MGKITGLMMIVLAVLSVLLMIGQPLLFGEWKWWFPPVASSHGGDIDAQFNRTLWVVGIAFTLAQIALGYIVIKYARRGDERATYSHGSNKLEATWTIGTAIVFIIIAILGQLVWSQLQLTAAAAGATKIEVIAKQFEWRFHYPGPDGLFGETSPEYVNDGAENYAGINPEDANGRDDSQVPVIIVPVGRPVELTLRSRDVIHSFFVPQMRIKQDVVPGMAIKIHFTATEPGRFEIPCVELCGLLHYNMKGTMLVVPQADYDRLTSMGGSDFSTEANNIAASLQ
jgi:cytochrome c oxidase subunit 2